MSRHEATRHRRRTEGRPTRRDVLKMATALTAGTAVPTGAAGASGLQGIAAY